MKVTLVCPLCRHSWQWNYLKWLWKAPFHFIFRWRDCRLTECPCCGHPTEIHNANGSKTLHCTNPDCPAKFISKLTNFVSKNGMDIKGLSENTLEVLVEPTAFGAAKTVLNDLGITEFEVSEITFIPNETITIPEGDEKEKFVQLLDVLDELQDVQNVYHNVEL